MTDKKLIVKWKTEDAGCHIGSHHGWYGHAYMVDLAVQSGYPISDEDAAHLDRYRRGSTAVRGRDIGHEQACDAILDQGGIMDQAETWMNENVAPDGYSFGWFDGEFFLKPVAWWQDGDVVAKELGF